MEVEIVRFEEILDYDVIKRAFITKKKVIYTVNGSEHSLSVSLADYNAGKTRQLIDEEIKKIAPVFEVGSSPTKKK
jgi:hypothetical protein